MKFTIIALLILAFPGCAITTKPCSQPPPGPAERCRCTGGLWYCDPVPEPTPSPTPPPCLYTKADLYPGTQGWRATEVKAHGGQMLDITPGACGITPPCSHPDPRLAHCCLLSEEKGNQNCADALFGEIEWTILEGDVRMVFPTGNLLQPKIAEGSGLIQFCGSKDTPDSCVKVRVTATIPPCVIEEGTTCVVE